MMRTHHCNELRPGHEGETVTLCGWIDTLRDQGGVLFIDLRDREGITQVVVEPESRDFGMDVAHTLKPESVLQVTGQVEKRPADMVNPKLPTGQIDVHAQSLVLHNAAATPPFPLEDEKAARVNEDLRLRYRYLDLRRPSMYRMLKARHEASQAVRRYMDAQGFLEIETPCLFKTTPEGAREFIVPSRVHPGEFYALSQSPQQYKQMLMVAGVERYYQLARCFRDEDLRADRQPEFTQIDIEASFLDREGMYALIEGLVASVWQDVLGVELHRPFPRMPYTEAMNRFGVDKPDTRYGLELVDFSDVFGASGFKVFAQAVKEGGAVKAINAKGLADATQGEMKALEDAAKALGAKGLAFIRVQNGEWKSPILKFFTETEKQALQERLQIEEGDMVFFAAAGWERACLILGRVRLECAQLLLKRGKLSLDPADYRFLWVIEFPLMLYDDEQGRYVSAHHPFTAPVPEDEHLLAEEPLKVRGQHYDLVLNGMELAGGSIRIHKPELQQHVFQQVLQLPEEVIHNRFGYMLEAFKYGAPPHGGIAFGFDRMVALLAGTTSIRNIIAFPKTQKGEDLMAGSPSPVTEKQLRDVHIQTVAPPEAKP